MHSPELDNIEGLLVSCRFEEASLICCRYLESFLEKFSVAFSTDSMMIMNELFNCPVHILLKDEEKLDKILLIILKCGYELDRKDEFHLFEHFCRTRGAISLAVALLWLQVNIYQGNVEFGRKCFEYMLNNLECIPEHKPQYNLISALFITEILLPSKELSTVESLLQACDASGNEYPYPEVISAFKIALNEVECERISKVQNPARQPCGKKHSNEHSILDRFLNPLITVKRNFNESTLLWCAAFVVVAISCRQHSLISRAGQKVKDAALKSLNSILGDT